MTNKAMSNALPGLVAALPEVYQPILGHPELSDVVSRGCEDRLAPIVQTCQVLEVLLNRPLRVLDLGCAQGFFSLSLAKLGAIVHGLDFFGANIAVCKALAHEHPEFMVSFEAGRVEDVIAQIGHNDYDLVLGLSVFHHIVHETGWAAVQQLLTELASKVAVGIFELALASEPLYWGPSQPQDPRLLLEGFSFVHELAQHSTHLSAITRPLYVASRRYWFLNGQAGAFETWQADSHVLAHGTHQGTRRFYFGDGLVSKLYYLDNAARTEYNLQEHYNETAFLLSPPPGFNAPRLVLQGKHEREVWLVRELLPGELLIDVIRGGKPYDAKCVIQDVLAQLVMLEAAGLYHNDVRAWNTLISPDGHANLIDYGAISNDQKDCVWPHDIFLAFLIFVYEVTTGQIAPPIPLRTVAISPYRLGQPYRNWLLLFWLTPADQWSFMLMQQLFTQMGELQKDNQLTERASIQCWMNAMEEAVDAQVSFARHLHWKQQQAENQAGVMTDALARITILQDRLVDTTERAERSEARATEAEAHAARQAQHAMATEARASEAEAHAARQAQRAMATEARADKLQTDLDAVHAANHHHWQLAEAREQQIQAIYQSSSWRITKPLRWLGIQTRRLRDQSLVGHLNVLVKKIAKFVLRRCIRFVNAHLTLRRFCVYFARKFGVYTPLSAIYLRLYRQHDTLTALNLEQMQTDSWDGMATPLSPLGTITIDELLSRIRAELATAQKGRKQQ
ncbi:MAG: methyltransferase domain-containing protein [Syntrophales bacterium]